MHTPPSRLILAPLAVMFAGFLAGCGSTPLAPEQKGAAVEERKPQAVTKQPDVVTVTPATPDRKGLPAELTDPKNILSKRSVYFDYDKYDVKDQYKDLVSAHAKFLSARRDFKMRVLGNADERGSREYNLALGQKRAEAVKKALTLLGAKDEQVESVSLGEEKPKAEGHDENAWSENRRGDMLYSGEY